VAAVGLTLFHGQCKRATELEIENAGLRQENSKLSFELTEKQSEVDTLNLIRKGPKEIAKAINAIPSRIEPKKGQKPVPATVVEVKGIKLIQLDPDIAAQLAEDANAATRKQRRIGELDRELAASNKKLRRARSTRSLWGIGGFLLGAGATTAIILAVN